MAAYDPADPFGIRAYTKTRGLEIAAPTNVLPNWRVTLAGAANAAPAAAPAGFFQQHGKKILIGLAAVGLWLSLRKG